jgi:predicted RNA-binding Zn ribbon-like protein
LGLGPENRWWQHAGVCNDPETRGLVKQALREPHEGAAILRAALRLREALYQIFKSILLDRRAGSLDLAIFNEALQAANSAREVAVNERAFEWRWKERVASLEKILWLVSESAADLLTKGDLSRLTQCGGDDCGWIFEDVTRNHSRQWCDTRDCGNRERVRRFRSRRAAEDD